MSMREYGVLDYGMIVSGSLRDELLSKDNDELSDLGITVYSAFSGTARQISKINGFCFGPGAGEEEFDEEDILILPLSENPSFFKEAYPSMTEMAREIREKFQEILPEGYPIEENLVVLYGAIFG